MSRENADQIDFARRLSPGPRERGFSGRPAQPFGSAARTAAVGPSPAAPETPRRGGRLRPIGRRPRRLVGVGQGRLVALACAVSLLMVALGWALLRPPPEPDLTTGGSDPAAAPTRAIAGQAEIPLPGPLPPSASAAAAAEIVVDPKGGGDARTIAEGIARAAPGTTVRIRPGIYGVAIELDKDVRLLGDPDSPQMVSIIVAERSCLVLRTAAASIRGIALRNEGQSGTPCVTVGAGRLEIEDVAIGSGSGSALAVTGEGDVVGRRVAIRDSGQHGVSVRDGGRLVLEDSEIDTSREAGVSLVGSGAVTLRNTRVTGNAGAGILVADGSPVQLIDNVVTGNAWSGIEVLRTKGTIATGNVVSANREAGIYLNRRAEGQFTSNRISGNGLSGIVVAGSTGTFDANQIQKNADHGVYLSRGGKVTLTRNRINTNRGHGIAVDEGSSARVRGNDVSGNRRNPQLRGPVERIR